MNPKRKSIPSVPQAQILPNVVNIHREIKDYRKELWMGVAIGVASASNSTRMCVMTEWADKALHDFDIRFGR